MMSNKRGERPEDFHSDLNIFAAIVAILEGGTIYTANGRVTAARIISTCKAAQQRALQSYDRAKDRS